MLKIIQARVHQKYRTISYPEGPHPQLPDRFVGRPIVKSTLCRSCANPICSQFCPTQAIRISPSISLDTGLCIFCRKCAENCPSKAIQFSTNYQMASSERAALVINSSDSSTPKAYKEMVHRYFRRSLRLRQVSAGGCNACEADTNVLNTVGWDLGRFGIQFVASPRHADGILVTGPVTKNMELALRKTYEAVPEPKIVIAVGACAISGGLFHDHPETCGGVGAILPVDLYIPGCPPHPLTILDGLLRLLGIIKAKNSM